MHLGGTVLPGCCRGFVYVFEHLDTVSDQSDHDCASKHELPYRVSTFPRHHNLQPEPRALGQGNSLSRTVSDLEDCRQLTCGGGVVFIDTGRPCTISNTKDFKRCFFSVVTRAGRSVVRISVDARDFSILQNV
jgi:hypothetical protein